MIRLEQHSRLADIYHHSLAPLTFTYPPVTQQRLDWEALRSPLRTKWWYPGFVIISRRPTYVTDIKSEGLDRCLGRSMSLNTLQAWTPVRARECHWPYHYTGFPREAARGR